MSGPVTTTHVGDVALVTIDDGKRNALSFDLLDGLHQAVGEATSSARGLAIVGRPGAFSAGFDLKVMGGERTRELMLSGAKLALDLCRSPIPVVFGVTGHALAMGAVLLCTADYRIGAAGEFKLGLNEVRIKLPVPPFAAELARDRLSKRAFMRSVLLAEVFDPETAVTAGWLDEVVPLEEVRDRTLARAAEWATDLDAAAFATTRSIVRRDLIARLEAM